MIKKLFLIVSFLVVSFCLAGFASYSKSSHIVLTKENPICVIKLPSNATTGYSWAIKFYDKDLLILKEHKYITEEIALVGTGGQEIFEFEATKNAIKTAPNKTKIKLIYSRSFEKGKNPIKERIFRVIISG